MLGKHLLQTGEVGSEAVWIGDEQNSISHMRLAYDKAREIATMGAGMCRQNSTDSKVESFP
jgi:hypothetical protein